MKRVAKRVFACHLDRRESSQFAQNRHLRKVTEHQTQTRTRNRHETRPIRCSGAIHRLRTGSTKARLRRAPSQKVLAPQPRVWPKPCSRGACLRSESSALKLARRLCRSCSELRCEHLVRAQAALNPNCGILARKSTKYGSAHEIQSGCGSMPGVAHFQVSRA